MIVFVGVGLLAIYFYETAKVAIVKNTDNWTRFDDLFLKYSKRYGVDFDILKAIALTESALGSDASVAEGLRNPTNVEGSKSSDGKSWGLMQVTLTTAREMDAGATPEKLNDADYSVRLGALYTSRMMKLYSKADSRFWEFVIKSYNQGPGNMKKEIQGLIGEGYSKSHWERFERNLNRVRGGIL